MIATFYLNPGKGEFTKYKDKWANEIWKTGMVYGKHTMTYKGDKDLDDARKEFGDCTKTILDMVPGNKPRLISWAKPGVGKKAEKGRQKRRQKRGHSRTPST